MGRAFLVRGPVSAEKAWNCHRYRVFWGRERAVLEESVTPQRARLG